jgi:hypothetical protein
LAFSSVDHTQEVESKIEEVTVKSTDYCLHYIKHPDTFLQRRECWTCLYGDFGLEKEEPSEIGKCKLPLGETRV